MGSKSLQIPPSGEFKGFGGICATDWQIQIVWQS